VAPAVGRVYVAGDSGVYVLTPDSSAVGAAVSSCISAVGSETERSYDSSNLVGSLRAVAVSPDSRSVYATGPGYVLSFARSASDGSLTLQGVYQCFAGAGVHDDERGGGVVGAGSGGGGSVGA
jgi:DNA-binding beta-propeller fold protein YncE